VSTKLIFCRPLLPHHQIHIRSSHTYMPSVGTGARGMPDIGQWCPISGIPDSYSYRYIGYTQYIYSYSYRVYPISGTIARYRAYRAHRYRQRACKCAMNVCESDDAAAAVCKISISLTQIYKKFQYLDTFTWFEVVSVVGALIFPNSNTRSRRRIAYFFIYK